MFNDSCVIFTQNEKQISGMEDLIPYHVGIEQCKPGHSWSGVRDHFLIHYIASGKGTFIFNGVTYNLTKRQGFLISPGMQSFYRSDTEDPWKYYWVGFNGRYAAKYLKKIGLQITNPIFTCAKDNDLLQITMNMIEAQKVSAGRDFFLTSLLYQYLGELSCKIECPVNLDSKGRNIGQSYVQKAMDYIQKNYSKKVTIEEIANYIGIERKYMSRLFAETLHASPQNYLIDYRMDKACLLLLQDSLSIEDIANSVGYSDSSLFSKMFKKRKGLSPSKYRDRLFSRKMS